VPLATLGSTNYQWTFTPGGIGPNSTVYSLGVGTDISFDLALIDLFGTEVFGFDPTPKSVAWIARQTLPERFHFRPWGVASRDGLAIFALTTRPDWTSYRMGADIDHAFDWAELPVRRLSTIMADLGHDHIDLLKMDIEGAEFEVIDDIASHDIPVGQLLVEFHYRLGARVGNHHYPGVRRIRLDREI